MQKIVVDKLAAQYSHYGGEMPYPCFGAPAGRYNEFVKELPVAGSYTNNMQVIDNNFNTLYDLNTQLSRQIEEIKQQNVTLQLHTTELKQQNSQLTIIISEQKNAMVEMRTNITTLSDRVSVICRYIPQFVRESSENFIRLLTGIRTNAINDVQLNEIRVIEN